MGPEIKRMRGHHLRSYYEFYQEHGSIGSYILETYNGSHVLLTDSIEDEMCDICPYQNKRCHAESSTTDRIIARNFGFQIGETYLFEQIKQTIETADFGENYASPLKTDSQLTL